MDLTNRHHSRELTTETLAAFLYIAALNTRVNRYSASFTKNTLAGETASRRCGRRVIWSLIFTKHVVQQTDVVQFLFKSAFDSRNIAFADETGGILTKELPHVTSRSLVIVLASKACTQLRSLALQLDPIATTTEGSHNQPELAAFPIANLRPDAHTNGSIANNSTVTLE